MNIPTNVILKLIVEREYPSAAEKMIERHGRAEFLSWDRPRKERAIERVARRLKINHNKFQNQREMGHSPSDIAEKACRQTKDDCPRIFPPEIKESLLELSDNDEGT